MKTASVSTVKNNLSAYLDLVREGEVVVITDRGRPIARLVPLEASPTGGAEARRVELERRGAIKRAEIAADPTILERLPPPPAVRGDALDALLREREEDR